jgi:K+-transporting ATPase KdpF subunit
MDISIAIGLAAALALLGYLGYALARPDKF